MISNEQTLEKAFAKIADIAIGKTNCEIFCIF